MSNELTKAAVDKVVEVTGMKAHTVRELLETGWTFSWDIKGGFRWDKNTNQDLVFHNQVGPFIK